MERFTSHGTQIAYSVHGEGKPCLLLHGFCGSSANDFVRTGWVGALSKVGRQVILMDIRGHGESDKPHSPDAYTRDKMIGDVLGLLDHLNVERPELIGFSMGGTLSLSLATTHEDRFEQLVVMGVGDAFFGPETRRNDTAEALEAESADDAPTERSRQFRLYAESLGQDLKALAAMSRTPRGLPSEESISQLRLPTLMIAGSRDATAGGLGKFEEMLPHAKFFVAPGLSHDMTLTHGMVKVEVLEFLTGAPL